MQASFLNVSESQIGLAECYKLGKGVERDNLKSYAWYSIALKNPDAQRAAYVNEQFEMLKENFNAKELEEDNKLVQQIQCTLSPPVNSNTQKLITYKGDQITKQDLQLFSIVD